MTFTLLPAIDVADGRVTRLPKSATVIETLRDPLAAALAWQTTGAEWIHLVDLDAAFGRGSNAALLEGVIKEVSTNVQLSGGIRDDASLSVALSSGCARVVLATEALEDEAWCCQALADHGDRLAIALDVRVIKQADGSDHHCLVARGTKTEIGDLWQVLAWLDAAGASRLIVTDIDRDGSLKGPNLDLYRAIGSVTRSPVIASGGISSIADLITLAKITASNVNLEGSIVGKALYAGHFTLDAALNATRQVRT